MIIYQNWFCRKQSSLVIPSCLKIQNSIYFLWPQSFKEPKFRLHQGKIIRLKIFWVLLGFFTVIFVNIASFLDEEKLICFLVLSSTCISYTLPSCGFSAGKYCFRNSELQLTAVGFVYTDQTGVQLYQELQYQNCNVGIACSSQAGLTFLLGKVTCLFVLGRLCETPVLSYCSYCNQTARVPPGPLFPSLLLFTCSQQ